MSESGTGVRRIDHIGILVRDIDEALVHFRDRLGLSVSHSEEFVRPRVRLAYLDAGNVYLQLVQPLDPTSSLAHQLDIFGEGLHHICVAVDDMEAAARAICRADELPAPSHGSGRPSIFLSDDPAPHGVRIECTPFRYDEDIGSRPGWLVPLAPGESSERSAAPDAGA